MKKLLSVLIFLMLLFCFVGCSNATGGTSGNKNNNGKDDSNESEDRDNDDEDKDKDEDSDADDDSDDTGMGEEGDEEEYCTVTVLCDEGITVTSQNPLKVPVGSNAVFTVKNDKNIAIQSVSEGKFMYSTGTLTLSKVDSDVRVIVKGEKVGYDTSVMCDYVFMGKGAYDDSSRGNGKYSLGVSISVSAGKTDCAFVGWSSGATLENGGTLISANRDYTFKLSPSLLSDNGVLYLYSNYSTEANVLYYDLNGGTLNESAGNMQSDYYTVLNMEQDDPLLKVTLSQKYFDATGCASTFYDDGIFFRSGYILTEYNTKADGSGVGYSIGSKFPLNTGVSTLYCIWSKQSNISDFEYEDVTIPLPSGVNQSKAPHWASDGIMITAYNGNDDQVVIPESINGKAVTAIASGAFVNKDLTTLVMGRRIIRVEDGAFVGCSSLKTIYYPDGIYDISNDAFDSTSFGGVKNFYVNATLAPRFAKSLEGAYALKLTRLLYYSDMPQIIVIAGSSTFQGLSTQFLEALLDGEYNVVNFGTTRTTQGTMYLEAMGSLADSKDIVLYAPENSAYMMGERRLYWKTLRDMEGMYNVFRYVDISGYDNVLGAFAEFNKGDPTAYEPLATPRYKRSPVAYESIVDVNNINVYGEYQVPSERGRYVNDSVYQDVYKLTFNNRFKSIKEGAYMSSDPNEDYYTSEKWCDITDSYYKDSMNRVITAARAAGAKIYFTFCPSDGLKLSDEVKEGGSEWLLAYDNMIIDNYLFDGLLGSSENYIYHHNYFYNNAFHLNDYGRTYRTYDMYRDLASLLGISEVKGIFEVGTSYEGCLFEPTPDGSPRYDTSEYFE